MIKTPKKIMIVVWKWDFLSDHLNANLLRTKYGNQLPDLDAVKGQFHDVYQVMPSLLCPDALLVPVRIYKDGPLTLALLESIIEMYLPDETAVADCQVMLFLHRANFFDETDISHYLNKYSQRLYKAFLFANGRDYIYSNASKEHIGLLNHMGEFDYGRYASTGEKYFVADDDEKIVHQPYFDRVWSYYDVEFETKVFDLKEDLFDCLYPIMLPGKLTHLPTEKVQETIHEQDNGLLWYRLKSFMGLYKQDIKDIDNLNSFVQEELELIRLKEAEKERAKSYMFDDCIANLERERLNEQDFLSTEYEEVKKKMMVLFTDEKMTQISLDDLRDLAAKLNYLVKIIPGVID